MTVTVCDPNSVSLQIFKTLPEFNDEREKYATWRSTIHIAIKLLDNHRTSMKYFEALMIIRNKITGPASNVLNNFNTVFNFEAIIERLDFTYSDQRPLYILEQELMVLQQNKLTMDEFFNQINEKLNPIVNKVNMTYSEKDTAKALIEAANEKALRTFITGLNHRRGEILYASNPKSLPEAYARLQTIIYDQERIRFSNQFNYGKRQQEDQRFGYKQSNSQDQQNSGTKINKTTPQKSKRKATAILQRM